MSLRMGNALIVVGFLSSGEAHSACRKVPNAAIDDWNMATIDKGADWMQCASECKSKTVEDDDFVCRSFDLRDDGRCHMSSKSGVDEHAIVIESTRYDHYDCMTGDVADVGHCRVTPNAALPGYNNKHLIRQTLGMCVEACKYETEHKNEPGGFECKSFDFNREDGTCSLSSKTAVEVPLKSDYTQGMNGGNPFDFYDCQSIDAEEVGGCKQTRHVAILQLEPQETLSTQTVGTCAEACKDTFWCKSFNWWKGEGKCGLFHKSELEVGGLDPAEISDHFECSQKATTCEVVSELKTICDGRQPIV